MRKPKTSKILALDDITLINISEYENKLNSLREKIVELEIEINDTTHHVTVFEARLNLKFGAINHKLKKIDLQILEYKKRIELLRKENGNANEVENQVKSSFLNEKRKLHDLENEYNKIFEHYNDALSMEAELPKLTTENETELKRLFRKLSLKYHPDKGGDANIFIEINKAYKEKDLDRLRYIDENYLIPGEYEGLSLVDKLARVKKQCEEAEKYIDELNLQISKIKVDQSYLLMVNCQNNDEATILENIYLDIEKSINHKTNELDSLIKYYQDLISNKFL